MRWIKTIILLSSFFIITQTLVGQTFSNAKDSTTTVSDTVKGDNRITIGGYGEAVYKYNFFSDNMFRYTHSSNYTESKGHGRVDIPHAVFLFGYDFGRGWTFNTEVEFEHGGTEAAVEVETEETGEHEKEIERGGEVALEQFWLQKSFLNSKLNFRVGHIVVPVGGTNNAHLPSEYFGVYRPEGENTIIPCTWHETGIELWGRVKGWRYDFMIIPALNSSMFDVSGWVHNGSASPYEFKVANNLAFVARVDNYSVPGLHVGLSGYVGNSFRNDVVTNEHSSRYDDVKGTVVIGGLDFSYVSGGLILRGSGLYGYLADASIISSYNVTSLGSRNYEYPCTLVGASAWSAGGEVGYDIFHPIQDRSRVGQRTLLLFVRYEYYDSYIPALAFTDYQWTDRHCISGGVNYRPIPEITIKAEAGIRLLKVQYNNEPWMALGVTWAAYFKHNTKR